MVLSRETEASDAVDEAQAAVMKAERAYDRGGSWVDVLMARRRLTEAHAERQQAARFLPIRDRRER